jgi:hypothetical protein
MIFFENIDYTRAGSERQTACDDVGIFPAGQPIRLGGRAFDLLSIAREQESKLWELHGAASLARLWRDQGHLAARPRPTRPALRLVHRGL